MKNSILNSLVGNRWSWSVYSPRTFSREA